MSILTPQDIAAAQARVAQERQQAAQDIADIDALAKFEPFNRYWARRLNEMYQRQVSTALSGGTPADREECRVRANLLRELTQLPAQDRQACENVLARKEQAGMPVPKQAL